MSRTDSHPFDAMPAHLRSRGELTGSREYLWPPDAALDAIRWVAERNAAIVVVEQYGQRAQARGQFVREWQVAPRSDGEGWDRFVRRAARAAEEAVAAGAGPGERFFFAVDADG